MTVCQPKGLINIKYWVYIIVKTTYVLHHTHTDTQIHTDDNNDKGGPDVLVTTTHHPHNLHTFNIKTILLLQDNSR